MHLQELLDALRRRYNTERPHHAIANMTPMEKFRQVDPSPMRFQDR